jgi:hypothetical protein
MQCARIVSIASAGLWLICASHAFAQERTKDTIQLRYTAPDGCPDRDYVLRAIAELAGEDAKIDPTLDVTARVAAADGREYQLNLRWRSDSGSGQRVMEAETCQAAADAAAWLITLAMKREDQTKPERPEVASADALRYELGANAAAAFGVLPGVAWGASLRGGIAWRALHADVSFSYFPAKSVERAGAAIDLDLLEVGLEACYLASGPSLGLGPCARAAVGQMSASSTNLRTPMNGNARFQMLALGVQLRGHLADSLWLVSDAALAWHERRPVFVISGEGALHQPRAIGLWLGLGLVLVL